MMVTSVMSLTELGLQEQLIALIRAFGLHRPDQTPCGEPVAVAEAHALMELAHGVPLSQNDLAARLQLEKSTVSRLVGILEARG
jgi:DNA-binding MarR family transcriptional regulator